MGFFPGSSVSQRPTELFCASAQTKLLLVHPNKRTTGPISFGSFSAQWPQPTASEYGKLLCLNIWTVPEYPSQGRRVVSEGEGWVGLVFGCVHMFSIFRSRCLTYDWGCKAPCIGHCAGKHKPSRTSTRRTHAALFTCRTCED